MASLISLVLSYVKNINPNLHDTQTELLYPSPREAPCTNLCVLNEQLLFETIVYMIYIKRIANKNIFCVVIISAGFDVIDQLMIIFSGLQESQ
jgi:hypothetical protein